MKYVYYGLPINRYLKKTVKDKYIDEIKSLLYISLLELDREYLFNSYDKGLLDGLCIQIIKNQYLSSSSSFYKHIKNSGFPATYSVDNLENINTDIEYDKEVLNYKERLIKEKNELDNYNEVINFLKTIHWYDKKLFEMRYIDGYNMRTIEQLTGIPYNSISYSIQKTLSKLRKLKLSE